MKAKIKKMNSDGVVRLETGGDIKEILINEEFLHPQDESISLCFKGKSSSGIIELTIKEVKELTDALKKKQHLIKDVKVIR
jgi:hypothetical protein